ncbi:MAG: PAS domain-containing protein [Xanthomonadales bacterium]|nr:PAS domain-containing protein [Xanthomonadales bacterium]
MPLQVFFWLLVVLVLSLALSQIRHRRKIARQIEAGIACARDIVNATPEGVVTSDRAGKISRFNQAAESIFGYEADNIVGKDVMLLLAEESHEVYRQIISKAGSDRSGSSFELMACKCDGTRFPVALTVHHIRENGKDAVLGMFRDISARRLAEVNSRRSRQFMEFLLQSSSVVFYTCNMKHGTTISYVSPNVETLLGYKPETIIGTAAFWRRYVHPEECQHVQANWMPGQNGRLEEFEYRLKTADGSYRWIADGRIVVNDENGEPNLLIGCWADIQKRKEMQLDLELQQERLRISSKCAKLAIWDWTIKTGTITWSGHIQENSGLKEKGEMSFDEFIAMAHPEDEDSLQSAFKNSLVQDEPLDIECRAVWPDKSIHWIHMTGELVNDESGCPVRMVGALDDITVQKKLRVASPAGVQVA